MSTAAVVTPQVENHPRIQDTISPAQVAAMLDRYEVPAALRETIRSENLLPAGLLSRLQATYSQHSALLASAPLLFKDRAVYAGLEGFRNVVRVLSSAGIHLNDIRERELFIEVYRFRATCHTLNCVNWSAPESDPIFHLVMPQPGMLPPDVVEAYLGAPEDTTRQKIAHDYIRRTNPHDGNQLLNKPWMPADDGGIDVLEGSQHKYPQCQLVFDQSTQSCFSFCTYCFRHAQVRGDADMFVQSDIGQVIRYLRQHKEVTDVLITGGDAAYIPLDRLRQYIMPILEDPELLHVRTVRLGTRVLTYQPELILSAAYDGVLDLFDQMHENGVQLSLMAHLSTPRELLNPITIAAIRRLQRRGVVIRSQSPIMNHISLFMDEKGNVDIERSAQNWIDLGNLLATLLIRFHSMYCARPTGEHHYFTAPLTDIEKISNLVFRSLPSLNRPSRYITMTTSAGKVSLLGETIVNGERAFALKFNEARNMAWMDKVFLARYDALTNRVDWLTPFDTDKFFFEDELKEIEHKLIETRLKSAHCCPDAKAES